MSEHGKFSKFFELAKDKNTWTNFLKQHEEAILQTLNHIDKNNEHEINTSYTSSNSTET